MELTGKAKEDFEKWYCDIFRKGSEIPDNHRSFWVDDMFYSSRKPSEQYGVYVDFFDSAGIYIDINPDSLGDFGWEITYDSVTSHAVEWLDTRPKARSAAITKANELYNSKS